MGKQVMVNSFLFNGNEKKYLNECIDTGWISGEGPFIEKFEKSFSAYTGRAYGVAVCNGTAALDIAVKVLGIGPGDEVIVPTFTIISPLLSILKVGAIPVLVDSEPKTWNMDVPKIEEKITSKTKAILVVHIYGLPADMDGILSIALKHKLKVIEDAAEMHGQTYNGKMCGSFGDISIFSFYPNKHITTGEGGMIVCDDPALDKECRKHRNLCFEPDGPRFIHHDLGWNYRMTNMQAALGLAQLEQIDHFVPIKRKMGAYYMQHLSFLADHGYSLPPTSAPYAENIYWVFGLVAPDESEKVRIIRKLSESSIGSRPFFWCMHEQPVFQKMGLFADERYPVAETMGHCGFYIPSGLGLTKEDMDIVIDCFKDAYR